jgi:hypothetical protein
MVPSKGGGTKLIRTLRAADGVAVALGEMVDSGELVGVGDSWPKATLTNTETRQHAIRIR